MIRTLWLTSSFCWISWGSEARSRTTAMRRRPRRNRRRRLGDPFDLCLIDWKMPYINGIETARRIREASVLKEPVSVLMTAYDTGEITEESKSAGSRRLSQSRCLSPRCGRFWSGCSAGKRKNEERRAS